MNQSTRYTVLAVTLCALIIMSLTGCGQNQAAPQTIKIGGIFDLTGPTSTEVAYADGERDYIEYINSKGGVNGKTIEFIYEDYAYNIPRAEELYSRLVKEHKVIAILGWGTGDTEALRPRAAADKIPLFSTSYAEGLTLVSEAPYNFPIGVTYSDQMRIALRYIVEHWTDAGRKPRVAFFYNDTPFGLSPIQAGRDYAAAHGIELVGEQVVALSALDATAQLQAISAAGGADYGIINETSNATATIVRSANQLGLKMQFITLNWGVDEKMLAMAGSASEGLLGTSPFVFPYEDVPGIAEIRAALQSLGKDDRNIGLRYVQGWTTARVLLAGIEKAGQNPSGESIRSALETLAPYDTGGVTAPLMFSPASHKGATALKIYQVKNGRWEPISDYIEATP